MKNVEKIASKAFTWLMFAKLILKIKWFKFKYRYIKR